MGKEISSFFSKKMRTSQKRNFSAGTDKISACQAGRGKCFLSVQLLFLRGFDRQRLYALCFLLCILFVTIFHGFSTDYAKIFPFFHKNKAAELFEMHKVPQKTDNESCNLVTDVL